MESADGSYHSYTFPIERTIETDSLENLVFSLKPDGSYKTLIVTYNTTAQEKLDIEDGLPINLTNKVSKYEINDDGLITEVFNKAIECLEIVYGYCSGTMNHPDGLMPDGSNCPAYTEETIATIGDCGSPGSGPSGDTGSNDSGSDSGDSSSNTPSNTGNNTNGGQTNNGGNDNDSNNDATTPTTTCTRDCPEEFDDGTPNTPCQELHEVSNTPSKLAKLIDLKNSTGLNQEVGFTRTDTIIGSPNSTVEYQDMIWNAGQNQLLFQNPVDGQLYSDYGHTHYDVDYQLSVFSMPDLYAIYNLLQTVHILDEQFNIFLVTVHGTKYALKFKNLQSVQDFVNFGNIWFSDWEIDNLPAEFSQREKIEDKFENEYRIKPRNPNKNHKNEKRFVKFLDDFNMGLDLYKANDDFSQWEKVNPDGTKTPC